MYSPRSDLGQKGSLSFQRSLKKLEETLRPKFIHAASFARSRPELGVQGLRLAWLGESRFSAYLMSTPNLRYIRPKHRTPNQDPNCLTSGPVLSAELAGLSGAAGAAGGHAGLHVLGGSRCHVPVSCWVLLWPAKVTLDPNPLGCTFWDPHLKPNVCQVSGDCVQCLGESCGFLSGPKRHLWKGRPCA